MINQLGSKPHHDELNTKLLIKGNKIELTKNGKLCSSKKLSNLSLHKPHTLNPMNPLNSLNAIAIEPSFFNDNHSTGNDNDLDNLNNNITSSHLTKSKQIKSTSFESNLTDEHDYNESEPSVASDSILNDSRSNLDDDDFKSTEIDVLLDKTECEDQKIVEVVSCLKPINL